MKRDYISEYFTKTTLLEEPVLSKKQKEALKKRIASLSKDKTYWFNAINKLNPREYCKYCAVYTSELKYFPFLVAHDMLCERQ